MLLCGWYAIYVLQATWLIFIVACCKFCVMTSPNYWLFYSCVAQWCKLCCFVLSPPDSTMAVSTTAVRVRLNMYIMTITYTNYCLLQMNCTISTEWGKYVNFNDVGSHSCESLGTSCLYVGLISYIPQFALSIVNKYCRACTVVVMWSVLICIDVLLWTHIGLLTTGLGRGTEAKRSVVPHFRQNVNEICCGRTDAGRSLEEWIILQ